MTAAQKTAKAKFKQAIAYRQKTGVSLKEAFAHIYGRKVKAVVKKRLGALPVGFKGSIYKIPFKIVNQYDIYNDVSAIMEDTDNGNRIVAFDGKGSPKDKAEAIVSYIDKITQGKYFYKDDKQLYSRMLKFATNMQKEVKDFNAGKKKTIKKEPLKILAPKNIVTTKKRLPSVIKLINKTIDKVYKKSKAKKSAPKKKAAKKVIRKVVKKKAAPKKVAKKKLTSRDYDKRYQALKPGKRTSASGNTYYEYRENRVDYGKLLGIKKYNYEQLDNIRLTRVNNDINGNPRYVVHFLEFLNNEENSFLPFSKKYEYALKKAKKIGGRKFHNKQYGGGIVFQSYNTDNLKEQIIDVMETTPKIKY
jgi:hypothetical protein